MALVWGLSRTAELRVGFRARRVNNKKAIYHSQNAVCNRKAVFARWRVGVVCCTGLRTAAGPTGCTTDMRAGNTSTVAHTLADSSFLSVPVRTGQRREACFARRAQGGRTGVRTALKTMVRYRWASKWGTSVGSWSRQRPTCGDGNDFGGGLGIRESATTGDSTKRWLLEFFTNAHETPPILRSWR